VTTVPSSDDELVEAVRTLSSDTTERREQVARASAMFVQDPIDPILQLVKEGSPPSDPVDRR
jgi:hypothetical protein